MFEQIFSIASGSAVLSWLLLAVIPKTRPTRWITGTFVPVWLSVAYTGLILAGWSSAPGGFGSLVELRTLFTSDAVLLAGWLHYLAFDLLIGTWIVRDARERGIPHWTTVPALAMTFLFGPAGYLLYRIQRLSWRANADIGRSLFVERLAEPLRNWVRGWEPVLVGSGIAFLLLAVPTLFAFFVDPRLFDGEAVWLKPLRFELSLGVYLISLGLYWPLAGPGFRRTFLGNFVIWAAVVLAYLEGLYIAFQAGQGLASHYNLDTAFNTIAYGFMGGSALVLTAAAPALAFGIIRNRPVSVGRYSALRLSIVLGLFLTFVLGASEGGFMSLQASHFGPHADGGETIPIVGWSRMIGDLRVAHFFGIHVMHVLPVVGLLASWFLNPRVGRLTVIVVAILYSAFVLATFVQALAGQPLLPL